MKNKLAQIRSLKKALKNYKPLEKDDKKDEVQEDVPGNAVGQGGVDMNPTGGKTRLKQQPMQRFEPAFDKRHKNKKLLLTKFRQHAYGNN
tara:strand:- start:1547 stop:1816 length:270 start_codon:yes stop_codon:yes gene_type:complete